MKKQKKQEEKMTKMIRKVEKICFLTGAGISAESGISTFRDSNGLWENYRIEDVASIEGWYKNRELVNDFYNQRRKQLEKTEANDAHILIAELEKYYNVFIVTQNIDNLHEKAGSTNIIHLHGQLTKACNEKKTIISDIGYREIKEGELANDGSFLRPFIVWFGEDVPLMEDAINLIQDLDILVVVGTSLNVYPAANLINYAKEATKIYLIDPKNVSVPKHIEIIQEKATVGMKYLFNLLTNNK